jgi:hypothetical protein
VLSEALAMTGTVPRTVASALGAVISAVGAVASNAIRLSVLVEAALALPTTSRATPAAIVATTVPSVMPFTATL